jgi:hypothetical protein
MVEESALIDPVDQDVACGADARYTSIWASLIISRCCTVKFSAFREGKYKPWDFVYSIG